MGVLQPHTAYPETHLVEAVPRGYRPRPAHALFGLKDPEVNTFMKTDLEG